MSSTHSCYNAPGGYRAGWYLPISKQFGWNTSVGVWYEREIPAITADEKNLVVVRRACACPVCMARLHITQHQNLVVVRHACACPMCIALRDETCPCVMEFYSRRVVQSMAAT